MKKNYLFIALMLVSFSYGQELLSNPSFEYWDNANSPSSWTAENTTQEPNEVYDGNNAAAQISLEERSDISQDITGLTEGETITLSIWYKSTVEDSDFRIWSYWINADGSLDYNTDADLIQGPNNDYLNNLSNFSLNTWIEYTVDLTVPAGKTGFRFEVRGYTGATVYWDDFSFLKTSATTVDKNKIDGLNIYPNPVTNKLIYVTSNSNENKRVTIYDISGKIVCNQEVKNNEAINLNQLKTGLYLAKVIENDKVAVHKLLIK